MTNHTAEIMRHKEEIIGLRRDKALLQDENRRLREQLHQQEMACEYAQARLAQMRREQMKQVQGRMG